MKLVIDTNIVFSAILNTQSKIAQILISGSSFFEFYSVALLKEEIGNHQSKILKISGYSEKQYLMVYEKIISKINFIDDVFLSDNEIEKAFNLTKDVDENDTLFIALANELRAKVWTGDKKLLLGLRTKGYHQLLTTDEVYDIFLENK